HAAVPSPGRSGQHRQLIGGRVLSALRPSLLRAVDVDEPTCLHDRSDAALWKEDDIKHAACRYSIRLCRRAGLTRSGLTGVDLTRVDLTGLDLTGLDQAAENLRVRFSMQCCQAIILREFRRKLGGCNHRLLICARL